MAPKHAKKTTIEQEQSVKVECVVEEHPQMVEETPKYSNDQLLEGFPVSYLVLDAFESMSPLQKEQLEPSLVCLLRSQAELKGKFKQEFSGQLIKLQTREGRHEYGQSQDKEQQQEEIIGFQMPPIDENQIEIANLISSFVEHNQELRRIFFQEELFKLYNDF